MHASRAIDGLSHARDPVSSYDAGHASATRNQRQRDAIIRAVTRWPGRSTKMLAIRVANDISDYREFHGYGRNHNRIHVALARRMKELVNAGIVRRDKDPKTHEYRCYLATTPDAA